MTRLTKPNLHPDIISSFRHHAEVQEEQSLHPKAALSKDHSRYSPGEEDYRLPYKHDVDNIVHSKAYSRYVDKTQVAYLILNEHITHRSLHVQLVSSFSRGIAEILRLNVDLVEAIALGHDVGHPPFGHEGEGYLSELSIEHGNGPFTHPWQSCRLLTTIEPLNLGLAVYDGFLCHDGGMSEHKLVPRFGKSWEDHLEERKQKQANPDINISPGTLEGCLVKLCDTMSYLGRDIEDAISMGLIKRESVPKTALGTHNREILISLADDLIKNSYMQDYIAISPETYHNLRTLWKFNFDNIYNHPTLKVESSKIRRSYRILFNLLFDDLTSNMHKSFIWTHYLQNKPESYLETTSHLQMVVDYISGMTDSYFIRTLEKLTVPKPIELT